MRIRRKTWAEPELDACEYFIKNPAENRGSWQNTFLKQQEIHLDLGCGKSIFLAEIAEKNPQINYIGIDISRDILGVARRNIESQFQRRSPDNLKIFMYDIEKIDSLFSQEDKISRIYINFCNPWPKARSHKRRLTYTKLLERYKEFLPDGGEIWFKTDNYDLYLSSLRYFKEAGLNIYFNTTDLHSEIDAENVITEHELMFTAQGISTKAIRATLPK